MKKTLLFFAFLFCFLDSANAQFSQNFDSGTGLPLGWSVINGGAAGTWNIGAPGAGTANSGTNVAKITYDISTAHNDYLITPQITVVAGVNDRLTYMVRNRSAAYVEHFDIKLSNTNAVNPAAFTTTLLPDTAAPSTWTKMYIDLTPYVGQTVFVGFHAISVNKWELYFDDIVNDTAPVCNYSAPVATVTQPTCTATGSVTLTGLPSTGNWTLYTTRVTFGIPQETINSTATGFGSSTTVTIAKDDYAPRSYSYYFVDENGCQSPTRQISLGSKYHFNQSLQCTYQDTNNDGLPNVGDRIICHVILGSGTGCDIGNGLFTLGSGDGFNQFASLGVLSFPGNSTQIFDIPYSITQQDLSNGYATCSLQVQPQATGYGFSNSIIPVSTALNTNGIRLNAFVDLNGDGIKEASEPLFAFGDFQFSSNNMMPPTVISSSTGSYLIPEWNAANSYTLSFTVNPLFSNYLSTSTSFTGITAAAGTGITDYYFPVINTNTSGDLQVNVIPIGNAPRPGMEYKNRIAYINNFSFPVSGTLTFTKDNAVTITSISQSGTVENGNGFSSTFFLQPYESRYMDVVMQVNTSAGMGNLVTNSATITIPANDVYPQNNSSSLTQAVVNSFDPNNKTETHGGQIVFADFSNTDYLTYTINFENIGTANANMVKIEDYLDFRLDANSLMMVSSSHDCILEKSGSFITWKFNSINLIPQGKGFVTFKIKPLPGYSVGTIIPNTANIFFDFNASIATNTATTEFVFFLNTDELAFSGFNYSPNPVKNSLFISNTSVINQIEITSVLGQKIMIKDINELQSEIDLSHLQSGIYFVKAKAEGKEKTFRIIKQ